MYVLGFKQNILEKVVPKCDIWKMALAITIPVVLMAFLYWWFTRKPKPSVVTDMRPLLSTHVRYYQRLSPADKARFAAEVQDFLNSTSIEGVGMQPDDLDRVLVAASAVIPIFRFPGWRYRTLTNVIIYPDTFNEEYKFEGDRRHIMGMVGSGALNGQMLLSRNALHAGFSNQGGTSNTGIHEFVHLVDKADGTVDGMPESLLQYRYSLPWLQVMHEEIRRIESGESTINPYAAMNESEFLAVTAEYFFERPDLLEAHHPELYRLLSKMFRQDPNHIA